MSIFSWKDEQFDSAIDHLLGTEDAKNFKLIFQDLQARISRLTDRPVLDVFVTDAKRRLNESNGPASAWFRSITDWIDFSWDDQGNTDYKQSLDSIFQALILVEHALSNGLSMNEAYCLWCFNPEKMFIAPQKTYSNTVGWTEVQIFESLENLKTKIDWENTKGSARKWWEAFESESKGDMRLVHWVAEELHHRNATVTQFFHAYVYSGIDHIQGNLHYLDYDLIKKEIALISIQQSSVNGSFTPQTSFRYNSTDIFARFLANLKTNNRQESNYGSSIDKFDSTLTEIKEKLSWSAASTEAQLYWNSIEQKSVNNPRQVLMLALQILERNANLSEFYEAKVESKVDDIQAILHFLDYSRSKRNEETQKKAASL